MISLTSALQVPQRDEMINLESITGYNFNSGVPTSVPSSIAPSYDGNNDAPSIRSIPASPPPLLPHALFPRHTASHALHQHNRTNARRLRRALGFVLFPYSKVFEVGASRAVSRSSISQIASQEQCCKSASETAHGSLAPLCPSCLC